MALRDKTKYTGVYTRTSKTKRYLGKADVCFEITYKVGPKLIWEKVGWKSEGYTAVLASEIRAERIRVSRHPDQFPSPPKADPLTRHPRVSSIMLSVVFGLLMLAASPSLCHSHPARL